MRFSRDVVLIKIIGCFIAILATHAYAASASLSPHPSNFGFIDILSWQVREGGADNWAQTIPAAGTSVPIRILDAPFKWNRGLRIGVGHIFEPTGHDVILTYTRYHALATNQATGRIASSFDANYFANNTNGASFGPSYQQASIRWQFYYNMVDIDVGHAFYLDKFLQIHPYLGLKTASIKQRIFTNWYNPTVATNFTAATENLRNDFTGVGPSIGIDTTWPIFAGTQQSIRLIGNFVGAMMYGHWSFSDLYANNAPVYINIPVSSVNGAAPMAGGMLGFQWANQFAQSQINLSLGYEVQMWFNQIQFYSLNGGRLNRSTAIQGVDFECRYNF